MENLIDDNKLIIEFMGLNEIVKNDGVMFKDNNTGEFHKIKYHSDWNWLMLVLDEIEGLGYWVEIRSHKKGTRTAIGTQENYDNPPIANVFRVDKIESVYNACVEFIKWHILEKIAV